MQERFMNKMNDTIYTRHVGEKFHPDGQFRYFPGATVISPLEADNPMHAAMTEIQQTSMDQPYSFKYAFLPPSSFHMTVFVVYNDLERNMPGWSSLIDPFTPAAEVNSLLNSLIQKVDAPESFTMKIDWVDDVSLKLLPADEETEKSLRLYRDNLSEITGIRFPDHDDYQFHMSYAYNLRVLDKAETEIRDRIKDELTTNLKRKLEVFKIGRPIFCTFTNMASFIPYK